MTMMAAAMAEAMAAAAAIFAVRATAMMTEMAAVP